MLFITGFIGSALEGQLAPGMAVIAKPFALDALASRVHDLIEAAPVTAPRWIELPAPLLPETPAVDDVLRASCALPNWRDDGVVSRVVV